MTAFFFLHLFLKFQEKQSTIPALTMVDTAEDRSEEQAARSFLRRRFLHFLIAVSKQKMDFVMHEHTNVSGEFGMMDIDVQQVQVSNLQTPIGVQKEAILRTSDIVAFTLKVPVEKVPES